MRNATCHEDVHTRSKLRRSPIPVANLPGPAAIGTYYVIDFSADAIVCFAPDHRSYQHSDSLAAVQPMDSGRSAGEIREVIPGRPLQNDR